jgi:hypothetical protein
MSKQLIKIILFGALSLSLSTMYSQINKSKDYSILYIDLNDRALESYQINKDTTIASFSIYIAKYESKKAREKAKKQYDFEIKNIKNYKGDPDNISLPNFSISFYAYNIIPERLKTLKGVNYTTIEDFRKKNYKTMSPTYIIHRLNDGTYLKWKTYTIE